MLISKIRKKMPIIIISAIVIFIGGFVIGDVLMFRGSSQRGKDLTGKKLPDSVAIVGRNKISRGEFWESLVRVVQYYRREPSRKELDYLESTVLDMLIDKYVLLEEAREKKIKVIIPEVTGRIRMIRDSMIGSSSNVVDASIPGRLKYFFAESKRERQFRDLLGKRGISYPEFKKVVREDLIVEKVNNLLKEEFKNNEETAAKKKTEEVVGKIRSGIDFAEVARQYSDDEGSKTKGGDLGWFKRGTMVKEFDDVAFKLPLGQISDLVKSPYGYHIIQVLARKDAYGEEFEKEKESLRGEIFKRKLEEALKDSQDKSKPEIDPSKITVTEEEITKEYEEINARHILIKIKDPQVLLSQWLTGKKKNFKIEIIDPEILAYRYYNRIGDEYTGKEIDMNKAVALYENVLKYTPNNPYVYNTIGDIYMAEADKVEGEENSKRANDPYEQQVGKTTISEKKISKKEMKFIGKAIEKYKKAVEVAEEYKIYDGEFYYSLFKAYDKTNKNKSALVQLKKAYEFAGDDIILHRKIQEGFEKLGQTKLAKKEQTEIKKLEERENMKSNLNF